MDKWRVALTRAGDALYKNDDSLILSANIIDKREYATLYEDDRLGDHFKRGTDVGISE